MTGSLVRNNMIQNGGIKIIPNPYAKPFEQENTSLKNYRKGKKCHTESAEDSVDKLQGNYKTLLDL